MIRNTTILILFLIFSCASAFPIDGTTNEASFSKSEEDATIYIKWYLILINILLSVTMIISVVCCTCRSSNKVITNKYGWPNFDKCNFDVIDAHVLRAPRECRRSIESLTNYLKRTCKSELEKARGIYVWIGNNITYDVNAYFQGKYSNLKPEDVLRTGSAVCGGYAALYKELADRLELQCKTISGYSKESSWNGEVPSSTTHAWNTVKIDESWYFIDPTWGAGYLEGRKYVKKFSNFYFLCPETIFFYTHYPEDKLWLPERWKNDSSSPGLETWTKLLHFRPDFIHLGLTGKNFENFKCSGTYKTAKSMINISFAKSNQNGQKLEFLHNLYNVNNTKIENLVMIAEENNKIKISVIFPAKGKYKLDVFGKPAEKEGSSPELFTLKFETTGSGTDKIYPKTHQLFHKYFSPFECYGKFTTSNSMLDISFLKLFKATQNLAFTSHLYDERGRKVPNASLVIDKKKKIEISIVFPSKGVFTLDVFGEAIERKIDTLPKLFSLNLKNLGNGCNKKLPKLFSSFYERKGTKLYSPLSTPLQDLGDKNTKLINFDVELPGAIDAAINPGWNHLTRKSDKGFRWKGNISIPKSNTILSVKYSEGSTYSNLIEWSNHV